MHVSKSSCNNYSVIIVTEHVIKLSLIYSCLRSFNKRKHKSTMWGLSNIKKKYYSRLISYFTTLVLTKSGMEFVKQNVLQREKRLGNASCINGVAKEDFMSLRNILIINQQIGVTTRVRLQCSRYFLSFSYCFN